MIETANPEINVEDLMHRIREEVARRRAGLVATSHRPPRPVSASSSAPVNLQMETIQLPRFSDMVSDLSARQSYTLSDFLNFHDEAFIRNAYRAILHREPDVGGLAHYLTALRSGATPRPKYSAGCVTRRKAGLMPCEFADSSSRSHSRWRITFQF